MNTHTHCRRSHQTATEPFNYSPEGTGISGAGTGDSSHPLPASSGQIKPRSSSSSSSCMFDIGQIYSWPCPIPNYNQGNEAELRAVTASGIRARAQQSLPYLWHLKNLSLSLRTVLKRDLGQSCNLSSSSSWQLQQQRYPLCCHGNKSRTRDARSCTSSPASLSQKTILGLAN